MKTLEEKHLDRLYILLDKALLKKKKGKDDGDCAALSWAISSLEMNLGKKVE